MIIDGLKLLEGAVLENATIPSGISFPLTANSGELFFLTVGDAGFYVYDGSAWRRSADVTASNTFTAVQTFGKSVLETRTDMVNDDIDLSLGGYFTKTISASTTLSVSNVPASGTAVSIILDLTNAGAFALTWWTGVKWAGGTAPTLTAAGRDVLGFYTHDGGSTWTGLVLGKDVK